MFACEESKTVMIGQLNMHGHDKVETAIKRLQTFEPAEGYYLAFSGGKDSIVIKALADMAKVKYDAHYSVTTVDPPELVKFIRDMYPDVIFEKARYEDGTQITMWNLIPKKKMPPTRLVRYCCQMLKETGGEGRFKITGVRKAESSKRAKRAGLELSDNKTTTRESFDPDNPPQGMTHICQTKAQRILNPIIDWTDDDVWEFIKDYNIPYCSLYNKGFKRLGCVGCPMSTKQKNELERYPSIKKAYLNAFKKMIELRKNDGLKTEWETAEEVMEWWING